VYVCAVSMLLHATQLISFFISSLRQTPTMDLRHALILTLVAIATNAENPGSNNEQGKWAYQWYLNEPFAFRCTNVFNITGGHKVVWGPVPTIGMNDRLDSSVQNEHFQFRTHGGVPDAELFIEKVRPELHGVYQCNVINATGDTVHKTIFALNWQEPLYKNINEKYERNIIVAFVATAVFILPVITLCVLFHFHWEARHPEYEAKRKYAYDNNGSEMKQTISDHDVARAVQSSEGKGAYENPDFNTQL